MTAKERKIAKAKKIIAEIFNLTGGKEGDFELNRATDAMYEYIKEVESL